MKRLTEPARDRLVTILRCAADNYETGQPLPRGDAARAIDDRLRTAALEAEMDVPSCGLDRARALLEAARRVEETRWP